MKASELMVGDLVRVKEDVCIKKGTIVEIVGVDATRTLPKHGLVGCTLCTPLNHDDNLYGGYGGVWVAFLEPIPLTAEILKKNGFLRDGESWWYQDFRIVLSTSKGVSLVCGRQIKFAFVHELQHAMRFCGIDKKINI